jgi:NADH-quinone oxidoreductase subunit M
MSLLWLLAILVVGGAVAWLSERRSGRGPRLVALGALALDALLLLQMLYRHAAAGDSSSRSGVIAETSWSWIAALGIRFHLVLDGLSAILALLVIVLGFAAVACSWSEIRERVGFFHFNLLWVLAGILGVFLSADLLLFYFFWELMLVPMYLLIAIWGHENRRYAAIKFFLFTQAGGLLMLVAIVGLATFHHQATGVWSFDYRMLVDPHPPAALSMVFLLGFFAAFAVKLPVVPLHVWLADAHTEAPTAGSVVLAGLLLKTGGYGLIRFALPMFPDAARALAPLACGLGAIGIVYGALLAFAQTDLKRLVAYTSVSHMGFVLLGVFSASEIAYQGALVQMLAHGLATGGLFVLVGVIAERTGTRDLRELGGLWASAPRLGAMVLFFAMASLGLPGLANFLGELLVLFGSFTAHPGWTVVATSGLVLATLYSLAMVQRTVYGSPRFSTLLDLGRRELATLGALAALLVVLGCYPGPVFRGARDALRRALPPPAAATIEARAPAVSIRPTEATRETP